MQKTTSQLPEIKLVGMKTRTNNASEADQSKSKIPGMFQRYFQEGISQKIQHQKKTGTIYSVYTEYESDVNGDYTYFIGEEVNSFEDVPAGFSTMTIPAQHYAKFTNESGPMPHVCINMWQKIWQMSSRELGGEREYLADFEVYDERAMDPQNTVLDIYIGIKK